MPCQEMQHSARATFGRRLHGVTALVITKGAVNRENARERTHGIPLRWARLERKKKFSNQDTKRIWPARTTSPTDKVSLAAPPDRVKPDRPPAAAAASAAAANRSTLPAQPEPRACENTLFYALRHSIERIGSPTPKNFSTEPVACIASFCADETCAALGRSARRPVPPLGERTSRFAWGTIDSRPTGFHQR